MAKIDKKAQMMDAGTALFTSTSGFGSALGKVKAEMARFGDVMEVTTDNTKDAFHDNTVSPDELPGSTAECDLFLNCSNTSSRIYISCKFDDAGLVDHDADGQEIRRYAATFKEGDRNSTGTIVINVTCIVLMVAFLFVHCNILLKILAVLIIARSIWRLLVPSKYAQMVVKEIIKDLGEIK